MKVRRLRVRAKKAKSVTFTGCWTCRSRKVKCDERRSNGCAVCEKAGLECARYGLNLYWVNGNDRESRGHQRRAIEPERSALPSLSDNEIMNVLGAIDAIDAIAVRAMTATIGPFSIFQISTTTAPTTETIDITPSSPSELRAETAQETHEVLHQPDSQELDATSSLRNEVEETAICIIGEADSPRMLETLDDPDRLPMFSSSAADADNNDTVDVLASTELEVSPLITELFNTSCGEQQQTLMLIDHYVNHVAERLQPILHPSNPWRTIYVTLALNGYPELFLVQASTTPYDASRALFHGILSAAAFHLRNATGGGAEFQQLGLQHRIKALQALNGAPVCTDALGLPTVHLTAMLSLVTVDTMTGEDCDFPIHLYGCRKIRRPHRHAILHGDTWDQVNTIYRFLNLLARTTVSEPKSRPYRVGRGLGTDLFHSDERNVEYIYGVTPALANLLAKTCEAAEHITYYHNRREAVPSDLQEACKPLLLELLAWSLESDPFCILQSEDPVAREIVQCHARAFHRAVSIFYWRSVGSIMASVDVIDVARQVEAIWDDLTHAEDLRDGYTGGARRTAPMSWPAFIASCEAKDRQPWTQWWERIQEYSVGNFTRQWRAIQEVWSTMDADQSVTDWRIALRRAGNMVLPV